MFAARWLLVGHIVALVFGLIGMLVMIPNPWIWAGSPLLTAVFTASMEHAGAFHIWLGAAIMLVYGWVTVGPARMAIFLVASCGARSASSWLVGAMAMLPWAGWFGTSRWTALFQPIAYAGFQLVALDAAVRWLLGVRVTWKGRDYRV